MIQLLVFPCREKVSRFSFHFSSEFLCSFKVSLTGRVITGLEIVVELRRTEKKFMKRGAECTNKLQCFIFCSLYSADRHAATSADKHAVSCQHGLSRRVFTVHSLPSNHSTIPKDASCSDLCNPPYAALCSMR